MEVFNCVDHNKLWKIFKEMEYQTILSISWEVYMGQEATVITLYGTTDWLKTGKAVGQDHILSLCLFTLYAEYVTRKAGLDEWQLESRLPGEISTTSDMQTTPPWWQKAKRN